MKTVSLIFALFLTSVCSAQTLTEEFWSEDVVYFAKELSARHKNMFLQFNRAEFEADVSILQKDHSNLEATYLGLRLQQIAAKVKDLHTRVAWKGDARYPITFTQFGNDMYVTAVASDNYRSLLGTRLISISGMPVSRVMNMSATMISAENKYAIKAQLPTFLANGDVLTILGISDQPNSTEFRFESNGKVEAIILHSSKPQPNAVWIQASASTPLYASRPGEIYWLQSIADSRTLYVNYSRCEERKDLPFAVFSQDIDKTLKQNLTDRIVIDLRFNGGGNASVIKPLIKTLKRHQIKVIVLIGRRTFSSGYDNAQTIKDQLGGVLIGEPTGQKPNAFGESQIFTLPHSGLKVQYSTKFWENVSTSDPDALYPDIEVETDINSYLEGKDLVLQTALTL